MSVHNDNDNQPTPPDQRKMHASHKRRAIRVNVEAELQVLVALTADPSDAVTIEALSIQLDQVLAFANELPPLNDELLSLLQDEAEIATEVDEVGALDRRIVRAIKTAEARLKRMEKAAIDESRSTPAGPPSIAPQETDQSRLPKIEIPTFKGDVLEWQGFWDSFQSAIGSKDNIAVINKFIYLKTYLADEAMQAIEGLRLTADNYDVAVTTLVERFGDPETAKFAHFEQLLSIPVADKDPTKLKTIYLECEKHIRSLVALGLPEDTFGQVFTPIILSKLPRNTRLQLHRANGSQAWELARLRALMKEELQARELSDRFTSGYAGGAAGPPPSGGASGSSSGSKAPTTKRDKPPRGRPWTSQGSLPVSGSTITCAFCSQSHFSSQCSKFKTATERKQALGTKCVKCLSGQHHTRDCKRTKPCNFCQGTSHHSSLCFKEFGGPGKKPGGDSKPGGSSGSPNYQHTGTHAAQSQSSDGKAPALMKMATVKFPVSQARLYLDDGSTATYITNSFAVKLKLKSLGREYVSVGHFGSSSRKTMCYDVVDVPIPLADGSTFTVRAYATDSITCPIPKLPLKSADYPALRHLPLADTLANKAENVHIDILIGGDYLHDLMTGERISIADGLYLYGSRLGYIVAGRLEGSQSAPSTTMTTTLLHSSQLLSNQPNVQIEKFWSLEDIGIKDDPIITDDEQALAQFSDSVRLQDGRYEVSFPQKPCIAELPSNYGLAHGRLASLRKRQLAADGTLLAKYHESIMDQLNNGIIEPVTETKSQNIIHYLPHHGVVRLDKPSTKLRIVYDASAKIQKSGLSLNDCLYRGPVILQDLCGILLRFRMNKVAVVCDVEKAFLQVSIRPEDRDLTRFLWLRDPNQPLSPTNLVTYRFCRVPFGLICSQFLLSATVKHHLQTQPSDFSSQINENLYVDNIAVALGSAAEASKFYTAATAQFEQLSMTLRQWHSNSLEVTKCFDAGLAGTEPQPKVLGLPWDTEKDTLTCCGPTPNTAIPATKRAFLAETAKTFDPCGFFSPIVIRAKMVIQTLWEKEIDWDSPLPQSTLKEFKPVLVDLQNISSHGIPRVINCYIGCRNATHEIHVFTDASKDAFGAVLYIRSETDEGKIDTGLAFAKSRLAPLKRVKMSIPRLELMGAVTGAQIATFVASEIQLPVSKIYLWTDAKCVLHWLRSPKPLKTFVQNRIRKLKERQEIEYRYVPTTCNPADIISRGLELDELTDTRMWWKGPQFLSVNPGLWPENVLPPSSNEPEISHEFARGQTVMINNPASRPGVDQVIDPSQYSSWGKLLRVTVYVLRFCRILKLPKGQSIPKQDWEVAERHWISAAQAAGCADWVKQKPLEAKNLGTYTDDQGIIRCKGRLELSNLDDAAKFPTLLPKDHAVTKLILKSCHEKTGHAHVRLTLGKVRERYWIPQGRPAVHKVIRDCNLCRKAQGGPFRLPSSPPLPEFRVNEAKPFQKLGLDYFGPLLIRSFAASDEPAKVWVCLFTCCVTRAVHLELVPDLTAEQFLLCFRRFTAVHRAPDLIISDNAKQFKTASKVLKQAFDEAKLAEDGYSLDWRFIPESAPWMGGFYERLVGTVKSALKKTLGIRRLTLFQMQTLLTEIASIVNSRPLLPMENEPGGTGLTRHIFCPPRAVLAFRR